MKLIYTISETEIIKQAINDILNEKTMNTYLLKLSNNTETMQYTMDADCLMDAVYFGLLNPLYRLKSVCSVNEDLEEKETLWDCYRGILN